MDVQNLKVSAELEDESQDPFRGGEAGPVGGRVATQAADVRVGAKVQQLGGHLRKGNPKNRHLNFRLFAKVANRANKLRG